MIPEDFDALPIGSVVLHSSNDQHYLKTENKGWASCNKDGSADDRQVFDCVLGDGTRVTLIGQAGPKVGKKAARIAELEAAAFDLGNTLTRAVGDKERMRSRAVEAERALRTEREKNVDLATTLAAERVRGTELRSQLASKERFLDRADAKIATLQRDLDIARAQPKVTVSSSGGGTRGLGWDNFVTEHADNKCSAVAVLDGIARDPHAYLRYYSLDDTRIVLLWMCDAYNRHVAETGRLKQRLATSESTVIELGERIFKAERALDGK